MFKYLLLAIALIWLFYSPALRNKWRGQAKPRAGQGRLPETMVQCAHCGVHLPQGEALRDDKGRFFCSAAHKQAGAGPH